MRPSFRICLLLAAALLALASCSAPETVQESDSEIMLRRVKAVNRLTLAQMRVTKMATVGDLPLDSARGMRQTVAALADALKIGDRKAAYSYDTYLTAYVDLSEIGKEDLTVNDFVKRVTIRLPEPEVAFAGRDAEIREDHYRVTGLRSDIGPAERAALKEKMNTALRAEIEESDEFRRQLVENARKRGEAFFTELLGDLGYTVTVAWGKKGEDEGAKKEDDVMRSLLLDRLDEWEPAER